ncbi:HlyD family secretion protein [Bosea sp. LjRoot90]|uniref:hypothetical protein n=1 Tax=Bosea sp. LjRoot90 TaxID=3342342 RepID=UPI003ECD67EB
MARRKAPRIPDALLDHHLAGEEGGNSCNGYGRKTVTTEIGRIALGQEARVKIHAFNQRTTPELAGTVTRISADTSRDQQIGATFYTIRVSFAPAEFARLGQNRVNAGMQAEVFVKTEDRTPLEYIVKPLKDQIAKAFRER